jgi:hypothetical protein
MKKERLACRPFRVKLFFVPLANQATQILETVNSNAFRLNFFALSEYFGFT